MKIKGIYTTITYETDSWFVDHLITKLTITVYLPCTSAYNIHPHNNQ